MEQTRCWIREPFCGVSHFVGAILSIIGLIVLLYLSQGRIRYITGFAIYGASLIALYLASALYHSLHLTPQKIKQLMHLDHIAIYLLIAGTYTPVCLISLKGTLGYSMLAAEYIMAAIGISATLFWKGVPHWFRVTLYLLMGWLAIIAIGPLGEVFSPTALAWLVGGGIIYSLGTIIYATDKPHLIPGKFNAHDLWHIFVMGGSVCHFILMVRYVAAS